MRAVAELEPATAEAPSCSLLSHACGVTQPFTASGVQADWAARPIQARLKILRAARHLMAARSDEFASAISPLLARSKADTLVTELLPLLDACKFLEREAKQLLAPRKLGRSGRPLWLGGVWFGGVYAEIHREPLGHVLVIGPSNFPLFLPGVQTLQALAAGNSVTWKPGSGGAAIAELFARNLTQAGLPTGLLNVTGESTAEAQAAIAAGAEKVFFTGSEAGGRAVLASLAKSATPAVMELSGCDAVMVMPSAELGVVAKAVAFGLRLNGGSVCMSPRRLFASAHTMTALKPLLERELTRVAEVRLDPSTATKLQGMLDEAVGAGAIVQGQFRPEAQKPLVVLKANTRMQVARSDVFAPVISLLECDSMLHALSQYEDCPYALTAAIFCGSGDEKNARAMAKMLKAGTVLINDVIAPTADPRVPFGGRGASGYGVTRGAEGLLEMTAIKTVLLRRSGAMKHLDATHDEDAPMFAGLIGILHGEGFAQRWNGLRQLMKSARK